MAWLQKVDCRQKTTGRQTDNKCYLRKDGFDSLTDTSPSGLAGSEWVRQKAAEGQTETTRDICTQIWSLDSFRPVEIISI